MAAKIPTRLFTPVRIGHLEVKNRIALPAMVSGKAGPDSRMTEGHIGWYEARARGGTGLIIVELTPVSQGGQAGANLPGIWDDSFITGFKELTRSVHRQGARIFLQICHAGRQTCTEFTKGSLPVAPSAIPCPLYEPNHHEVPHELSVAEIQEIVDQFGKAAKRARQAEFDGLELHGAHGYLISEFMSPYMNKRFDEYGGDLMGRLRFPLEVIKSVRREVGADFPVGFRYSGTEFVPDGRSIEESKKIARVLEAAGVDYIHVSGGVYESFWAIIQPYGIREGFLADDAAAIRQGVKIPVIAVGKIKTPEVAEEILEQGKADMVAMGRQLICDPDWPQKVRSGDWDEIRPCISCTEGCINRGIVASAPTACIYNTSAGFEQEATVVRTQKPKKVLVIGGGPGGLEAARIAALRGHQVTLFEKSEKLGGRFNLACVAPYKQEFTLALQWLSNQIKKLGVQVVLGKEATPEMVEKIGFDVVIVATGATPQIENFPGLAKEKVVPAEDILSGKARMGNKVVIFGGGMVGCDLADFMAQRGKQVTIVDEAPEIGVPSGVPLMPAQLLIPRLIRYGVKMVPMASDKKVFSDSVVVTTGKSEVTLSGIDQIIVAGGHKPNNKLAEQLTGKVAEIYVIGDAKKPRTAFEATHEGAEVGRRI